jgi:hypothetical protein
MEWQQLLLEPFDRVFEALEKSLDNLSTDDLNKQPHPDCNSMGWLTWHLTRTQDNAISNLTGNQQIWIKDGWHTRFNRAPDPRDTGFGHKSDDITRFKSPEAEILLGYYKAVLERSKHYLSSLSSTELSRKVDHPKFPTVGAWLIAILNDNLQHTGQVAYLRGLLKGKGWLNI